MEGWGQCWRPGQSRGGCRGARAGLPWRGAEGLLYPGGRAGEQALTRCLVFCKLFLRILRISSSLSLDSAGRMRSEGRDLGWMFLGQ